MKTKYEREIELYERDIKRLNLSTSNLFESAFTESFADMTNKAKNYNLPPLYGRYIRIKDIEEIKEIFKTIILLFEDKDIIDYFKRRVEIIDVETDDRLSKDDAFLDVDLESDLYFVKAVILPKCKVRELTASSFSHEMGHIPMYEEKLSSIQENFGYQEVLSMFMEYLTFINFRKNEGEEYFVRSRLYNEQRELSNTLGLSKRYSDKSISDIERTFFMYEILNNLKYLSSLDLTLQLIELLKKDRTEVIKALKYVVIGDSSIEEVSRKFDLDTSDYKKLTKEFDKRMVKK